MKTNNTRWTGKQTGAQAFLSRRSPAQRAKGEACEECIDTRHRLKPVLHFIFILFFSLNVQADILDGLLPRKRIVREQVGVNSFANDPRFGTVRQQLGGVKSKLRLRYVRVLFAWNDQVQPTPNSRIFYGFYDDIARNIPTGVRALVVLTGVPLWMSDSANWIDGDPRKTFVEKWVKPITRRYRSRSRLAAYQIWNEPNDGGNPHNKLLELDNSPSNYLAMLREADNAINAIVPSRKVVNAATTAINQNYPDTLEYNQALITGGIDSVVDAYAIHYYGKNYLNVILEGGIADSLQSISKPIWVTESGERGANKQLAYVERTWTFLKSQIPSIQRFYYYQHTEASSASRGYGLRNLTPGNSASDLYLYLTR